MASKNNDDEEAGELIIAGCTAWSMAGRSNPGSTFDGVPLVEQETMRLSFSRLGQFIQEKTLIVHVFTGPVANHTVCLDVNRTPYIWGRNEDGQLGLGDTINRYNPTAIPSITGRIKSGACGPNHTILFTTVGEMFVTGRNDSAQLGIGSVASKNIFQSLESPRDVIGVSCGRDFSCCVVETGELYTWGLPQFGQLGNGGEHKSLEKAGKWTYQMTKRPERLIEGDTIGKKIVDVRSGPNHSCAIDDEGRIYTWGFGGYGRCGQGNPQDVHLPKNVEYFSGVPRTYTDDVPMFMRNNRPPLRAESITCGGSCVYVVSKNDNLLYFFGITKKSGEAAMTPQLFDGTSGWSVSCISVGNTSTILAATEPYDDDHDSMISFGPSTTYGELGYGLMEGGGIHGKTGYKKSSTIPMEVPDMIGAKVLQVAMGFAHSLAIVRSTGKSRAVLDKLDVYEVKELNERDDLVAAVEEDEKPKKKKRKISSKKEK